ncbi:serine/threonine-protein kinase [Paraliomyxa miuraensis]|uniref:serine/threonine-protein kinase n=1 Tax=Paraliomyxa miuraensis TaxID=376150 RepID=UPI002257241A|nr:serine/threonine-protein kinase [Paraliomyxa miuraensis]MCX4240153.1 serine/threonine protein kinase [Paraliomyxa miuraensis]
MLHSLHILTPGERFLQVPVDGVAWAVTYVEDQGPLWFFETTDGSRERRRIYRSHEFSGGPTPDVVPDIIIKRLSDALRPSYWKVSSTAQSILDLMAESLTTDAEMTGRLLRQQLGFNREQTDAAFRTLAPRYVDAKRDGQGRDYYVLRLPGLLHSKKGAEFTKFVEDVLAFYAAEYGRDANIGTTDIKKLCAATSVGEVFRAKHYLAVARLGPLAPPRPEVGAMVVSVTLPPDMEELSDLRTMAEFLRYVRNGDRSDLSPNAPLIETQSANVAVAVGVSPLRAAFERPPAVTLDSGADRHAVAAEPLRGKTKRKTRTYETAFRIYTRVKQLGQGGNGVVELVRDEAGREFALKLVRTGRLSTEQRQRLSNEIGVGWRLRHTNIVTVLDHGFFDDDGERVIFYVMPYFRDVLRKRIGSLQPEEAFSIAKGLAAALAHAHGEGVWHRDLKPENVAIAADGVPVLLDFGIAHMSEDLLMTPVETRETTRFGNHQYAAPEQRAKGKPSDHRADIYVFGMVLNELFTGETPEGKNHKLIGEVSQAHAELDPLVDRMMCHDPAGRPDANEVMAALAAMAGTPLSEAAVENTPSETNPQVELSWEYTMLYECIAAALDEHKADRKDLEFKIPGASRPTPPREKMLSVIGSELARLTGWIQTIEPLINNLVGKALGPPGQPGDKDEIEYLASRLGRAYGEFIQWGKNWRAMGLAEEWSGVVEAFAAAALSLAMDVERFRDDLAKALDAVRAYDGQEEVTYKVTLELRAPHGLDRVHKEAARILGVEELLK